MDVQFTLPSNRLPPARSAKAMIHLWGAAVKQHPILGPKFNVKLFLEDHFDTENVLVKLRKNRAKFLRTVKMNSTEETLQALVKRSTNVFSYEEMADMANNAAKAFIEGRWFEMSRLDMDLILNAVLMSTLDPWDRKNVDIQYLIGIIKILNQLLEWLSESNTYRLVEVIQ